MVRWIRAYIGYTVEDWALEVLLLVVLVLTIIGVRNCDRRAPSDLAAAAPATAEAAP